MVMRRLAVAVVLTVLVIWLGAGCGGPTPTAPPTPGGDPVETYRIVPGDVIRIEGGKNPAINKDARVDEQGYASLIYLGKVKAAGKTKSELEADIDQAYKDSGQYTDSQVSVTVMTLYYYVDGQVAHRGQINYVREIHLYQAIVDAGGFATYANPNKVRVLRPQEGKEPLVYVINCRRIMTGKDPDSFVVLPNDTIFVPRGY
jgi:protein involved in polysaccharide export with SLBB domain